MLDNTDFHPTGTWSGLLRYDRDQQDKGKNAVSHTEGASLDT